MVVRKVSKEKYLIAFLVTLGIFGLGLLLGLVIDGKRVEYVQFQDKVQTLDFSSLQLQYQFIDEFKEKNNCQALAKTFDDNIQNLELIRSKIESYQQDSTLSYDEFDLLKREYVLAQIRYWMLSKKTKEVCGLDHSTILYFFGPAKDCSDCDKQSFLLTYLKQKFGMNLLNFVFDGTFEDEPLIVLLKKTYGVEIYPTLVINEEKFEGYTEIKTILLEICESSGEEVDICENYIE
ncbi:hypothetical protein ACFLZB_01785 [Nanoarchaeota archaeon]